MKKIAIVTCLTLAAVVFTACGGSSSDSASGSSNDSLGINATPIDSISVYILDNNNTNGIGTTYEVYGLVSVPTPYSGFNSSMGTFLGSSDTNATFTDTTAYNFYVIVTDNNNRIYLDAVRGSNDKYYIPYTTSEVAYVGNNTDVVFSPTGVTYSFANKPDTQGTSIGNDIAGSYVGGSVVLDARGFNIMQNSAPTGESFTVETSNLATFTVDLTSRLNDIDGDNVTVTYIGSGVLSGNIVIDPANTGITGTNAKITVTYDGGSGNGYIDYTITDGTDTSTTYRITYNNLLGL